MKKLLTALALGGFISLAFQPAAVAAGTELRLVHPGELTVATEGSCPPYSQADAKGQTDGLENRLFQEIARRLNLTYKPVVVAWRDVFPGLEEGKFDIAGTPVDISSERQGRFVFADAWLESGAKILSRTDKKIETAADLVGKKVGVLTSSTWERIAREKGVNEPVPYESTNACVQAVIAGEVDAMVVDGLEAAHAAQHSPVPLTVSSGYLTHEQKGWAVHQNNTALAKALNKVLADMMADGTYSRITKEVLGFDPRPKTPIKSNVN